MLERKCAPGPEPEVAEAPPLGVVPPFSSVDISETKLSGGSWNPRSCGERLMAGGRRKGALAEALPGTLRA